MAAQWLGGTYEQRPDNWKNASPLFHAGKHTPPIIFINSPLPQFHAGRDDMRKILDKEGIYSEAHTFPKTPHPFWFFHPWFQPAMDYASAFLNKVFHR